MTTTDGNANTRPVRLGLTGGIGSGKSTVGAMLAQQGAVLLDADAISRSLTAAAGAAMPAIAQCFGAQYLREDGSMDRDRMRALVFQDPQARARLEAIVHPLVASTIDARAAQALAAHARCLVYDIPLLLQSQRWRHRMDKILVIDCSEATQRSRVAARSGIADAELAKIIAAQTSRAQALAAADMVLYNDGISLHELKHCTLQIGHQFGL